jgi:predicted Zn-dependent peptidase
MIHKIVLDNGLRIVFEEVNYVNSVTTGIWVGAGSMYENKNNNGISHLIEHMMFKGTKNRTAANIAEEIDTMGGQINAFTTKECTCYYTKTTSYFFEKSLEILSDMMFNSEFDEEELRKEKKVILEEIFMYDDSPEDYVHELLTKIAFEGNSISYPILGDVNSVNGIERDAIIKYIEEYYTADNIVISIVGNVSKEVVKNLCEKYFMGFKHNHEKIPYDNSYEYHSKKEGVHKNIEQFHFCVGVKGYERNSEKYHASNILNNIIGGSMSSRLFQNIREKRGLVYSIYSFNSSYKSTGLFGIYSALKEESLEEAFESIKDEIKSLKKGEISAEEFERAKSQIKGNYILSLESTSNRMTVLGRRELFYNETLNPEDIIGKIEKVSLKDVKNVSKELFDTDKFNIAFTGNLENNEQIEDLFNIN